MSNTAEANDSRHYVLMTVAIIIGIVGVFIRFAGDAAMWSWIGNTLMVIAVGIALKSVFDILGKDTRE